MVYENLLNASYQLLKNHDHLIVVTNFSRQKKSALASAEFGQIMKQHGVSEPWQISYGPHQKPSLVPQNNRQLFFSLSHSQSLLLVLLSSSYDLGVDVEEMKPRKNAPAIAKKYFSQSEQGQSLRGFYQSFTAREAFIKSFGGSLFAEMRHIQIDTSQASWLIGKSKRFDHEVEFHTLKNNFLAATSRPIGAKPLKVFGFQAPSAR